MIVISSLVVAKQPSSAQRQRTYTPHSSVFLVFWDSTIFAGDFVKKIVASMDKI